MAKFFNLNLRTTKAASPEAQAVKRARLMIDQAKAKNPAGLINDPTIYDKAIKSLDAFGYDAAALTMQANLETEKNKLMDQMNNQQLAKNNLSSALTNAQYQIGKNNAASPEIVIQKTAMLYDLYAQQLSQEIDSRRANGQAYDTLIPELQKAQDQSQGLASLSRSTLTGDTSNALVKQQYGFLAKTDPDTGKIISFSLQPLSAANAQTGYIKTDSSYGGVPLYLNGVRDPNDDNNLIAKLGNFTYKGNVKNTNPADVSSANGLNQKVLELQDGDKRSFGAKFMDILPGHHVDKDNAAAGGVNKVNDSYDLKGHITADLFSPTSDLPKGSVGQDSSGNYYLMNNDGKLFQSNDPGVIGQYLGKSANQVKADAYFLTAKDVQGLKTQQDPTQQGNSLLQDPKQSSPLNASSTPPTSMNTPPSGGEAAANHEAPPQTSTELAGGPEPVATSGRDRAVQPPQGQEKQQQTTQQITKGGPTLFAKAASALKSLV